MAALSKAWVCGHSLLGLWVRIPPGHGCLSRLSVVCCQIEVSASGWSLVQRIPTDCLERDHESSKMRRPWPTGGCCKQRQKLSVSNVALRHTHTHIYHAVVRICGQLKVSSWVILQRQSWMEVEVGRRADIQRALCCIQPKFVKKKSRLYLEMWSWYVS